MIHWRWMLLGGQTAADVFSAFQNRFLIKQHDRVPTAFFINY
jgi:hypothetical protein